MVPGFEILLPRWIAKFGFLDLSQVFNGKLDGVPFGFETKLACDLLATLEKSHLHSAAVLILSFSPRLQPRIPVANPEISICGDAVS